MKRFLNIAIILFFAVSTATAEPVKTRSEIKSITVFRQGAKIYNSGKVSIPAGAHEILIQGLSPELNFSSLQVRVPANVVLQSATFRQNHIMPQEATKEITILKDSIEILDYELRIIKNEIEVLKQEEDMILANKQISGSNTGVNVQNLKEVAKFFNERLSQIKAQVLKLQVQEKKKAEQLLAYRNQLQVINSRDRKPTGEILLQVLSSAPTSATIDFSYLVQNAGWIPTYDIRATDVNEPVKLLYKANIYQHSGIDWTNVKLTVSSGNPLINNTAPQLNTWFLDFRLSPPPPAYGNARTYDLQESVGTTAKAENSSIKNYVQVNEKQLNIEYDISLPYTIVSGGAQRTVNMKEYSMPATYQYVSVPKLDKDAFLVARIHNWEFFNLLPGNASLFFDHSYIGQSFINPQQVNDTLEVSLGRDNKIVVQREQLRDFTRKTWIGSKKSETFAFETSVRNNKKVPVQIEITDNIPISNNSDIEVKLDEAPGAKLDKDTGKLTWLLTLNPGETQKVKLQYTVRSPKDRIIPNL